MPGVEQLWQSVLEWWVAWWALPLDERIWECSKAAAALLGSWQFLKYLYRWIFRRRSRLEQQVERLEEEAKWKDEEIRNFRSEKAQLTAEVETTKHGLPETAISRAEREWANNNKARAIRELEDWFNDNAKHISDIALHLAKFHISRAVPDPGDHLDQARSMLRLARGASPNDRGIRELSRELDIVNAGLQEQLIRDLDSQIAWNSAMTPRPGTSGEGLIPAVNAFISIAGYYFSKGLWRLASIFGDRAADLALAGGPALNRLWCLAEASAGNYHVLAGRSSEGLQRVELALSLARDTLPADDEVILRAGFYRAHALRETGRFSDAHGQITTLLSVFPRIKGARHRLVLSLRLKLADVLHALGRDAEALDEIDAFGPIEAEELGARHRDVLTTRYHRAAVLLALDRSGEALSEIDALIPVHAEVKGERHPDVLATRHLRARARKALGQYKEALDEIDLFIDVGAEVIGTQHKAMLSARALHTELLNNLDRSAEALIEIDELLPVTEVVEFQSDPMLMIRVARIVALRNLGRYSEAINDCHAIVSVLTQRLGSRAPSTLMIHMLQAQALLALGRYDEALAEIDTYGPMHAEVYGEMHQEVLVNRLIRAMALEGLGRSDEARTEALETIARLNCTTDPKGLLLRSANSFLGNEERQPPPIAVPHKF